MAVILDKALTRYGVHLSVGDFKDLVQEARVRLFPSRNTEQLLIRPTEALKLCMAVKLATTDKLPDHVILGTLLNCRKSAR